MKTYTLSVLGKPLVITVGDMPIEPGVSGSGVIDTPLPRDLCEVCLRADCLNKCPERKARREAGICRICEQHRCYKYGLTKCLKRAGVNRQRYNAFIDAIESMALSHACAGVDVLAPAYAAGLSDALQAAQNHFFDREAILG